MGGTGRGDAQPPGAAWRGQPATRRGSWTAQLDRCSIKQKRKMIRPWFRQAAVPWKTTVTQTRTSGENRVSTKLGVLHPAPGDGVGGGGGPGQAGRQSGVPGRGAGGAAGAV